MSWFLLSVISVFGTASLIFICLGKPNQSAPNVLLRGLLYTLSAPEVQNSTRHVF